MHTREQGLTLLDVTIGAALLVIVLGLAYPGFKLADDAMTTGSTQDLLERYGDRMLRELTNLLRSGRVTGVSPAGETPSISVARLRPGLDIAELDATAPQVFEASSRRIEYLPALPISEALARTDLNGDGDREDSFLTGTLLVVTDEVSRPIVPRPVLLAPVPGGTADLDGDGRDDPLWRIEDRTVFVSLHLVDREPNGRLLRSGIRASVKLRNPQQE